MNPLEKATWHAVDAFGGAHRRDVHRVIAGFRPDVVHTHNLAGIGVDVWRLARACGAGVVHTPRDYYLACLRSVLFRGRCRCTDRCWECKAGTLRRRDYSNRYLDAVVGVSRYVLRRHSDLGYFQRALMEVVPNPEPLSIDERGDQGATHVPRTLAYVGSLIPEKGAHLLVEAFTRVAPADAVLDIYGAGDDAYVRELQVLARFDGRVRFLGQRAARQILEVHDAVAVPSICEETYGRVIAEASRSRLPVIFAPIGALAETAARVGAFGVLVESDTVSDWSEGLQSFFGGAWNFQGRYEPWPDVGAAHLGLYERLLRRSATGARARDLGSLIRTARG